MLLLGLAMQQKVKYTSMWWNSLYDFDCVDMRDMT